MLASDQPPESGLALLSALPASSTATHSDAVGQETPVSVRPPSIDCAAHEAPGGAGFTNAYPPLPTATQAPPGAQLTAFNGPPGVRAVALQERVGAVGFEVASACSPRSTATQSASDEQETELGVLPLSKAAGSLQLSVGAAPAGAGETPSTSAASSAASAVLAIDPTEG